MGEDLIKLRSSINSSLKRYVLLRGTFLAFLGMALIAYCGAFLAPETLHIWGLPAFLIGLALITVGLLPYRRLTQLELKPHEIILDDTSSLKFFSKGRPLFSLPFADIAKMEYIDEKYRYGIGLWLKKPFPEKILIHDSHFDMKAFQTRSQKKAGCDIFLPYFTKRSFEAVVSSR